MIRLLSIGDSTVRGVSELEWSPWGGSRGGRLRLLRRHFDVRPIGPTLIAGEPDWGRYWNTASFTSARAEVAAVFAGLPDPPDLVTCELGTNDFDAEPTVALPPVAILMRMVGLALDINALVPGVPIWFGQVPPITSPDGPANMAGLFNAWQPQYVQLAREAGANVHICPSMEGVTAADLCDRCHPTEAGYIKVGNNWYRDLRPALAGLGL